MIAAPLLLSFFLSDARAADAAAKALARDIYQELVELNTAQSALGSTPAAEAMAKRLLSAGFPPSDVQVVGPDARHMNVVARLRGKGKKKPILWICHLDVVEAKREDWTMDPFKLIEKDGFFYGRGTGDVKDGDALLVTTLIRFKKEGYRPDRDLIVALTADEENGDANGVDWLLKNRRDLIDAEFVLNPDAGNFQIKDGKKQLIGIQTSEKLYADFTLEVQNKGGHSSQPRPDNAIYQLAAALTRLAAYKFPFELNETTREYFKHQAEIVKGDEQADIRGILKDPPDMAAEARLSRDAFYNSRYHTTCVATRLEAGHANNALAGSAKAVVNCRILPGHAPEEARKQLEAVVADPEVFVVALDTASMRPNELSPLRPDVVGVLKKVSERMWPGLPVVPFMDAGASDSAYTRAAGMPSYGVPGVFGDVDDDRSHGRDERIIADEFYAGVDFFYEFNKALTGSTLAR